MSAPYILKRHRKRAATAAKPCGELNKSTQIISHSDNDPVIRRLKVKKRKPKHPGFTIINEQHQWMLDHPIVPNPPTKRTK